MRVLQFVLLGLSLGAIYALISLGFVAIYKGTKVINLAQGSIMLFGAFVVSSVSPRLGFWPALAVGITVAALLSVVAERVVSLARAADHLVLTILTIGLDIILAQELTRRIGDRYITMRDPWGADTVTLLGTTLPVARLWATGLGLVIIAIFFVAFTKTDFGVRMRASAQDPETAALMGISQRRVAMASWAIGGGLACLAGVFLAGSPSPGLDHTAHFLALSAVPAIIIGGLDSFEGAVVGGLVVGVTQSLVQGFDSSISPVLGGQFSIVAPYIVMLVFLLFRPSGLFGSKELNRV
ncbi:branched-chain amino acid ABC transporter permease [Janibacter sp. YIM B02568]|uniref:branched-chain amino acid ABC transporter permease n=1 Tax=Janibacter endophyticus TaxID=2806261 RepID=UPI0019516443|nr:branched-chain amino acid ABC transporter permease [Janibacter endophyticus]MBM6545359.1 branched-chain amino acid ABC transporter permease [Janibacter endophyticus]